MKDVIQNNNNYSSELDAKYHIARNSLRLHYVSQSLNLKGNIKKNGKDMKLNTSNPKNLVTFIIKRKKNLMRKSSLQKEMKASQKKEH